MDPGSLLEAVPVEGLLRARGAGQRLCDCRFIGWVGTTSGQSLWHHS